MKTTWKETHKESKFVERLAMLMNEEEKKDFLRFGVLRENRWPNEIPQEVFNHIKFCPMCRTELSSIVLDEVEFEEETLWDKMIKEEILPQKESVKEAVTDIVIKAIKEKLKAVGKTVEALKNSVIRVKIEPTLIDSYLKFVAIQSASASDSETQSAEMEIEIDGKPVKVKIRKFLKDVISIEILQ